MIVPVFKTEDVRAVCSGVSIRMLDYWITRGVIEPSHYIESPRRKRIYLFEFEQVVQVRIVKSLRDAGVSLLAIGRAIAKLKATRGKQWQSAWLVTDGQRIYQGTEDPEIVESLARGENGQLAFSLIAIDMTKARVRKGLARCVPVDIARFRGKVRRWADRAASA